MATSLLLPPLTSKPTRGGKSRRGSQAPGNNAPVSRKISPSYISSDLHSPDQKTRITIPFLGVLPQEAQILGGKTWGENPTSYGGIGKMPFLGKTRTKDLLVSRGQKHFSSGLSKYENQMQPYMLTAFKYSGCRQNDQVLPGCFKVGLNPYDLTVFDGSPIIPYFSHNCKNEVFPRNDPNRLDSSGQPLLSERTRNSLEEMYQDLYEEPSYNKVFPDHFKNTTDCNHALSSTNQEPSVNERQADNKEGSENSNYAYNINPTLAKLCFLSSRKQEQGKMAPLKILLMTYLEHPSVFSEFRFQELYRTLKDLELFSNSSTAKTLGVDLREYPLQRLITIIESEASNSEKLMLMREALGLLPQSLEKSSKYQEEKSSQNEDAKKDAEAESSLDLAKGNPHDANTLKMQTSARDDPCSSNWKDALIDVEGGAHLATEGSARPSIAGTSPRWPPSRSQCMDLRTMQLKCPSLTSHGQYSASLYSTESSQDQRDSQESTHKTTTHNNKESCRFDGTSSNLPSSFSHLLPEDISSDSMKTNGLEQYKQYLDSFLPVSFDRRGQEMEEMPYEVMYTPPEETKLNKQKYVGYDKMGRKTYLPPVPLIDCLQHTGDRVQDRIGLHFRTEAHKRFHAMYPDPVPDLRDNGSYRKRYFFSGYHTSVFRG